MSDNTCSKYCAKVVPVPQRVLLIFWCFSVVAISFAIRLLISFSIMEMIALPLNFTQDPTFDYCWTESCLYTSEVKGHEEQFMWNENQVGFIFGAFAIGYFLVQIPSGILVDLYSGKTLWGLGMILASILTYLSSLATKAEDSFWFLFILRIFIGLFAGPVLNSMNSIISKWFPDSELWLAGGIVYSGIPFGGMLAYLCGGLVIHQKHKWSTIFRSFGITGIVLNIIFFLFIYDTPEKHPYLMKSEKEFLDTNVLRPPIHVNEIPWRAILSNPAVIGLICVRAGQNFGFNILLFYMPKYISEILCLSLAETTYYSAIPLCCAFVFAIITAVVADIIEKRDLLSPTTLRKIYSGFSSILPAVFLVAASFCQCEKLGVIITFCITMFGMGFFLSGICTNELFLSRTFIGTISGINNMASAVTAFIGPIVVGFLVNSLSLTEWRIVMWIIFIVLNASTIPYMVWGSGKDQKFEEKVATLTPEEIQNRKREELTRKRGCIFL